MNILHALILSSFAGFATCLGALLVFLKKSRINNSFITFCLTLSITILIGISLFDLLPEGFLKLRSYYEISYIILTIIFCFTLSFIVMKIINQKLAHIDDSLYKVGLISMIILILHNLPEGLITFLSTIYNQKLGIRLSIAIALHNIPEGITIAMPIYYATGSRGKAFKLAFLSGLSEPLGGIISYVLLKNIINDKILGVILILVAFLMINLAIEEIFPKIDKSYKKSILKGFIIGTIIILLNAVL